jgi:hypothetical protein
MKDDSPRPPRPDTAIRLYSLLFALCRADSRLVVEIHPAGVACPLAPSAALAASLLGCWGWLGFQGCHDATIGPLRLLLAAGAAARRGLRKKRATDRKSGLHQRMAPPRRLPPRGLCTPRPAQAPRSRGHVEKRSPSRTSQELLACLPC